MNEIRKNFSSDVEFQYGRSDLFRLRVHGHICVFCHGTFLYILLYRRNAAGRGNFGNINANDTMIYMNPMILCIY